jgi:hypothetical protein
MARAAIAYGSAEQRSRPLDGATLVNLYPEIPPLGARAPALVVGQNTPLKAVLYGTPGLVRRYRAGTGPVRAMREALGYLWVLTGQQLYRIASDGTKVLCTGAVIEPSGDAMMSDNGRQLAVLVNGKTYIAGTVYARASFVITGGTFVAGTNEISTITVNAVGILDAPVNWSESNASTAAAVAAGINASAQTDYVATASGATVTLQATMGGINPNGYAVVVTPDGDVTVQRASTTMAGGETVSTEVTEVESGYPDAGASSIDYMDGYFVWSQADSAQFFISSLYNGTVIDALDFATAESDPSNLVRVIVSHRELWLLKESRIEIWANTGAFPFPFERIPGAVVERGCAAARSVAKADTSVFWLGDDRIIYRSQGYQPLRISEHWLEDAIRTGDVSDAYAMTYAEGGHTFYVLTFPTLNFTVAYDCATTKWHHRQSGTSMDKAPWQVRCIAPAFGQTMAGIDGGRVCAVDLDTYTEDGAAIRRVGRTPPIFAEGARVRMSQFEVECELGVGITNGQGSDPQFMVRWSDDGGTSWSNEHRAAIGRTGQRSKRAIVRRLGQFRQRTLEVASSEPVKHCWYGFRVEAGP